MASLGAAKVPKIKLNNGYDIPIIGLGTWRADPGKVTQAIKNAIDVGYRHFDCAASYRNEAEVGKGLSEKIANGDVKRNELFITTKLWNTCHRPEKVEPALRKSLSNLGLDYLDLYLIHWPISFIYTEGELFPKDENGKHLYEAIDHVDTWRAMEKCVELGLVRSIGLSNFNSQQIQHVLDHSKIKPAVNQVECHPYFNQKKLIEFCRKKDIVITAYSPLGSPARPWAKAEDPNLMEEPRIKSVAQLYRKTPAQILIRYQVNGANVSTTEDCYWSGTGPICDGKCRLGEVSEPHKNERIGCITGSKKYCCKTGRITSLTNVTELAAQRDKETSTLSPSTTDDCYWVGKSPNCEGSCLEGDYMASTSRTGNGSTCIVGKKKYCCKGSMTPMNNSTTSITSANVSMATASKEKQTPLEITDNQCHWVGEPPLCLGSCKFGEYVAAKSPAGDGGAKCESGQKKYCCARAKPTDGQTGLAKKTVRDSNKQSYNDVDPISNSSSRPVQPWLRPTPRDLSVNATGIKHRVNVVKIKRKLGLATTQSTSVSTSTETPTTTTSTTSLTPSITTETPTTTGFATSTTAPTTSSTTTPTPTSIKVNVAKKFLPLPDILPVPLMFRSRPVSNVARPTSIIPLSTTLASVDKQNETIVLTTTVGPSTVGRPGESLQVNQ
ncbi:mucin-2-like [Daphnia carinata]|uniref:mucin-2-like n=1 Tax=Daphnia carinata TaxID=120202 RepID=UPI002868C9F5|nr:mucin-2-like [Daphnia carinata]